MPKVVIAAGGTAGHVVPALAVADALRERGAEVEFIGGERAEAELVPKAGYELRRLDVQGISRSNPVKAARAVVKAGGAFVGVTGGALFRSGDRVPCGDGVCRRARSRPSQACRRGRLCAAR